MSRLVDPDFDKLEKLGPDNVRQMLSKGGGGNGSIVPGLNMVQSDVLNWLSQKHKEEQAHQDRVLCWAKAATLVGVAGAIMAFLTLILK